jgi:hypothetical protein
MENVPKMIKHYSPHAPRMSIMLLVQALRSHDATIVKHVCSNNFDIYVIELQHC